LNTVAGRSDPATIANIRGDFSPKTPVFAGGAPQSDRPARKSGKSCVWHEKSLLTPRAPDRSIE